MHQREEVSYRVYLEQQDIHDHEKSRRFGQGVHYVFVFRRSYHGMEERTRERKELGRA